MQNLKTNRIIKSGQIHVAQSEQLNTVAFDSPLQQVLQQQLPLLRLLDQQHKWQLWLSSRPMLARSWIQYAGLAESKVVQLPYIPAQKMVDVIEKALLACTSSYIVACANDLTDSEKQRLQIAVKASGTHLFLVNDDYMNYHDFMTMSKQLNQLH
ncbi:SulA-like leucine-rich domain-containing protein [Zophobihabitans entericus]|uniref:Cell division inhibitor SulA n=1 Tax=Zophobihabitans entericus TaxID=1635327 RepID=A0A6G9IER3_9GAMM|nr:SulA-like leucine-rich domain-containing protein [Zophobihabitans entericus]QIQ22080.1 hypothetical protein IPMB12_10515 [Zophobihabitans entericus]